MELSIKTITLLIAIFLTGLSAGLFYAWEFSVIPGTKRVDDQAYIITMKAINRAIINPAFMLIFFGSLIAQIATTYQFRDSKIFWWILAGTLAYALGTILITSVGNVPLNNKLDLVNIQKMGVEQIRDVRSGYELPWNRFHKIRTWFALLSFLLLLLGYFFSIKS